MNTLKEQLNEVLQKLLTEKTFSPETLEIVQKLDSDFKSLQEENKKLEEQIKQDGISFSDLKKQKETLELIANEYKERTELLVAREKAVLEIEHDKALLQKDVACHKAVSDNVKEVVGLVFKNTTVRKSVCSNYPVVKRGYNGNSDYMEQVTKNDSIQETEE